MSKKKSKSSNNPPLSLFNWFITLLISIIPGLNILFFIFSMSFASSQTKRRFAAAALILSLILLAAGAVMLFWFSDTIVDLCNGILSKLSDAPSGSI